LTALSLAIYKGTAKNCCIIFHMSVQTVLTSWKEIAAYLGKGVRTVQRWETELGLPIRRPNPGDRRIVLAIPSEIDAWINKTTKRKASRLQSAAEVHENFRRMQRLIGIMNERMQQVVETASKLQSFRNPQR
jgi:predicted DNA-binding transcriptional regulator AlpA